MLKINDIVKEFPGVKALDGITLEIQDKEFFGLLGPNGAGKSTLINIIVGYLQADKGNITYKGKDIKELGISYKKRIGLVPQTIALYEDLNAIDNLKIFGSLFDIPKKELKNIIEEKLSAVGLYERRKDLIKNYSGGMKRRLNIIAALLHNPDILLCDEPTVGVDPQSRNAIFNYLNDLNEKGMTIIYTTHYMEEAEKLCKRIGIIDYGKIIALGTLDELLSLIPPNKLIYIARNNFTETKIENFNKFGTITTENCKYKLEANHNFKLSEFFKALEENGVSERFIEIYKPNLETLFLNLTGRIFRD
ncbi:MAG: ABC transporter ATP-binding protein [Ignavibacteria bacterium]|nr:ABC transporter ATP-binding protein [Ignavibacteria bacterium]